MLIDTKLKVTSKVFAEFLDDARDVRIACHWPETFPDIRTVYFVKDGKAWIGLFNVPEQTAILMYYTGEPHEVFAS